MGFPWGVRVTLSVNSTPTFARRLQQARLHTGLSQKELGIRAGLDPYVASPRVNQYERGKHEPKLETAERLAQALGSPPPSFTPTMICWPSCSCAGAR